MQSAKENLHGSRGGIPPQRSQQRQHIRPILPRLITVFPRRLDAISPDVCSPSYITVEEVAATACSGPWQMLNDGKD